MTDPLDTLRAGCQQGEMPDQKDLPLDLRDATGNKLYRIYWADGFYLDALAALQEALWPGSVFTLKHIMKSRMVHYRIDLFFAYGGDWRVIGEGEVCPAFDCAWLDAFLAGLQEKDDG